MSTEQNYAPRESYAIAIPPSAKKSPRITSRPYERQIPIPVDLVTELWRPVVGFEGFYEVSSSGRVKGLDRKHGRCFTKATILKPKLTNKCYYEVGLWRSRRKCAYVHRLVAMAFIPNPNALPCVNHIDANPKNNKVENLEWITQAGNIQHAVRLGRWVSPSKPDGIPATKVNGVINDYLNPASEPITQQQLSVKYGLSIDKIKRILRQHSKSNRHDQQTLESIVCDYRTRKTIGLTTAMIARRYGLTEQAIRKIVARANKDARRVSVVHPSSQPNYEK